ncbi:MAG: DUF1987 domain-containing protein [Bacteroidota bacterium]|nr:DUF1987 domain-containing protein [Bacteroidota bacterium]
MEIINMQATGYVPGIVLDKENGKMELSGRACPEDPLEFYQPVFDWLDDYAEAPLEKTVFDFRLSYYNTATSKILMMLMQRLEELSDDGNNVLVRWHYMEDDEDMQESGEDYAEMVEVEFEFLPYEDE